MCTDIWSMKEAHTGCRGSLRWASPPGCSASTPEPWPSLSCLSPLRYTLLLLCNRNLSLSLSACWTLWMFVDSIYETVSVRSLTSASIQRTCVLTHSGLGVQEVKVSTRQTVLCASFIFPQVKHASGDLNSVTCQMLWDISLSVHGFLLPSGITAECQQSRSQLRNRDTAMQLLRAHLYQSMMGKETEQRHTARKLQVTKVPRRLYPETLHDFISSLVLCVWIVLASMSLTAGGYAFPVGEDSHLQLQPGSCHWPQNWPHHQRYQGENGRVGVRFYSLCTSNFPRGDIILLHSWNLSVTSHVFWSMFRSSWEEGRLWMIWSLMYLNMQRERLFWNWWRAAAAWKDQSVESLWTDTCHNLSSI